MSGAEDAPPPGAPGPGTPEPGAPWRGAGSPDLTWSDGTPQSTRFGDTYFSRAGGPDESHHVFLNGNELPHRWQAGTDFTIAETGFGTGLNFLTTWQAWRQRPVAGDADRLHYVSIEAFPLTRADLQTAASAWPALAQASEQLLAAYPPPLPGLHRLQFGRVCLDLVYAELAEGLEILLALPELSVDAWYLDGFAPARNPEMWTPALYHAMANLSAADGSFATFTAAGEVRRGLVEAGFAVSKAPGFGRKRDMLRGKLDSPAEPAEPLVTPWHLPRARFPQAARPVSCDTPPRTALVLGAGLAGAAAARSLAERGLAVEVYDAGEIAGAASGNPQGALYTRLSHQDSPLTRFALHSFLFACRLYRGMLEREELQPGRDGELCGLLQLRPGWGPGDVLYNTVRSLPGLVEGLDDEQAVALTGVAGCDGGLYYPGSGWLNPAAVSRVRLQHPHIRVIENCGPVTVQPATRGWRLANRHGELLAEAPVLVVACGANSADLVGADWLQLQAIRGQTSQVASRGALKALRTVICHEGYLPPAREGEHCLGATFAIGDSDPAMRTTDHRANIEQLARALPTLTEDLPAVFDDLPGRVGYRCATPDYLPVAGPVPDAEGFCEDYAELRRNARQLIPRTGSYRPGLYFSAGHGSRGLTSTPLCGELLAAQVCGEPWPMPADLARALAPARFLVRALKRNRV